MDIYNIYSVGDCLFLQQVFNAIAMLTNSARNDYITLCVIGALIGVILSAIQVIFTQKGFEFTQFLVCFVLWVFMFGGSASVNVQDVYSGESRKIDNVPRGVAVTGWVLSSIGYQVTQLMETAFSSTNATGTLTGGEGGSGARFGDALYVLNAFARLGYNDEVFDAINKDINGTDSNTGKADFKKSVINYVRDCTYKSIQLRPEFGGKVLNSIPFTSLTGKNEADGVGALQFNSQLYFTKLSTASGEHSYSCAEAWPIIHAQLSAAYAGTGNLQKVLVAALEDKSKIDTSSGNRLGGYLGANNLITNAVEALGLSVEDSVGLLEASLFRDVFQVGMMRGFHDARDTSTALMLNQARAQRNVQWAAEQSMFIQTMRPMMTFVEGFCYAITPFAGFIMLMGLFGLKLVTRYLILIVWVQSWLPVTAIVNMYLNTSVQRGLMELKGYTTTFNITRPLDTFYTIDKITDVTQDWIATGGMFAAAVPLITLFIFTGSVYSLTTLSSRMAGQDHIRENVVEQDRLNPAALVNVAPAYNSLRGMSNSAADTAASLKIGNSMMNSLQSSRSAMQQSMQALNAGLNYGGGTSWSGTAQQAVTNAFDQIYQTSSTGVKQAVQQIVDASGGTKSYSQATQELVSRGGNISGGAQVGASNGFVSGSVGGNLSYSSSNSVSNSGQNSSQSSQSSTISLSDSDQASLLKSYADRLSSDSSFRQAMTNSSHSDAQVQKLAQQAASAAEQYSQSESWSHGWSSDMTISTDKAAMFTATDREAAADLSNEWGKLMTGSDADALKSTYEAKLSLYKGQSGDGRFRVSNAEQRAKLETMSQFGKHHELSNVFSNYLGSSPSISDPLNRTGITAGDTAFNTQVMNSNMNQASSYFDNGVGNSQRLGDMSELNTDPNSYLTDSYVNRRSDIDHERQLFDGHTDIVNRENFNTEALKQMGIGFDNLEMANLEDTDPFDDSYWKKIGSTNNGSMIERIDSTSVHGIAQKAKSILYDETQWLNNEYTDRNKAMHNLADAVAGQAIMDRIKHYKYQLNDGILQKGYSDYDGRTLTSDGRAAYQEWAKTHPHKPVNAFLDEQKQIGKSLYESGINNLHEQITRARANGYDISEAQEKKLIASATAIVRGQRNSVQDDESVRNLYKDLTTALNGLEAAQNRKF